MDPLSVTASIIAVLQLSSKVLAYFNDVKDASKERARCAIEASNLHSLLLSLRFRLEEGDADTPWFTAVRALAIENGPLDQFKAALEALLMPEGGRLKKAGDALVWKFRKEEAASILQRIERLKTLVEIALEMDHFKLSQAIKEDTSFVRSRVPIIQSGVDEIRRDQDSARRRRLLDQISSTDFPAQQSDIIKRRQEGTCQWLLDAPELAKWLQEPKGTLFCPGIPGAGKTMVAAIAVDHLLKSIQDDSGSIWVVYMYCNYKAQEQQDVSSLLAAILKQLVQAQPSTPEPIERLYETHAKQGTTPSLHEIVGALRDVLSVCSTVYIVIDALDECLSSTRDQLLDTLRDLQATQDVRLMATSRFIPDIVDTFHESLKLEVLASEEDVRRYVAGQIYRLPACIKRDPALQDTVQEKIAEAVDGMFLLARLHTDSLLDKRTPKAVKSTLAKLERGSPALDKAYEHALQRIDGQLDGDSEDAKRVITWITFAERPLTTEELCCALAVEPNEAALDPENVPNVEDLVSICAGLVVVDLESDVIRLVHYTTQEYFERIRDRWLPDGQLRIATTCLTYLSFDAFQSGACSTVAEYRERFRQHKLIAYAAQYWGNHAQSVEAEVADLACSMLVQNGLLSCVAKTYIGWITDDIRSYGSYRNGTALHYIAKLGLCIIAKGLLSALGNTLETLKAKDRRANVPIETAALYGHADMVKLLLDKVVDINTQHDSSLRACRLASGAARDALVKLLFDGSADINALRGIHGKALYAASTGGKESVVKLLLDRGVDVNALGGPRGNRTALHAALEEGDEAMVKLLLDNGASIDVLGARPVTNAQSMRQNMAMTRKRRSCSPKAKMRLRASPSTFRQFATWEGTLRHLGIKICPSAEHS